MIQGVEIHPLRRIPDERGCIHHMLRSDAPHFTTFGEIYFSSVYPGVVKGWHLHKRMTLNYAVPIGMIKLVLYDDRAESPTRGELQEIYLGEQSYDLVRIPPLVWNGFKGMGGSIALVANCSDIPHGPGEIERMDPHQNHIPYAWALKDR
jgi:dTDP-4-dehydrorhamnose 3,5-epimerase